MAPTKAMSKAAEMSIKSDQPVPESSRALVEVVKHGYQAKRGLRQLVFTGITFNHGVSGIAVAFEGDLVPKKPKIFVPTQ